MNSNDVAKTKEWLKDNLERLEEEIALSKEEKARLFEERTRGLKKAAAASLKTMTKASSMFKRKVKTTRRTQADNVSALMANLEFDLLQVEKEK